MSLAYKQVPGDWSSFCPECFQPLEARFEVTGHGVFTVKNCPAHGETRDLFFRHPALFDRCMEYMKWHDPGPANPNCPQDCGLCQAHASPAAITNIDLTNACNLRCPFCFAAAETREEQFWPDREQLRMMLEMARPNRGHMATVQFSGGEPTLSPHFFEAISMARDMGYLWVQAVTNGIKFGRSPEYARQAKAAGLKGVYLQFDGVEDRIYRQTRGQDLMALKEAAIENCRRAGLSVTLVVTLAKGVNDDQVGPILDFAVDHLDAIVGLSFQPLAFTGRVPYAERMQKRYTLSDLAYGLEAQTGGRINALRDFVPLSATQPISRYMDLFRPAEASERALVCSCHPLCGLGTYLLINQRTKEIIPLPRIFDWDGILQELHDRAAASKRRWGRSRLWGSVELTRILLRHRRKDGPRFPALQLVKIFDAMTGGRVFRLSRKRRYEWRLILAAGMHFMDNYNFLAERSRSCVVHYSTPDGRIIPFCTYNAGPAFRTEIEERFKGGGE